ncbi:MAG: orotidine-5'-phosphate decarboxylase [Candidatus Bathyarchaeota archaeon]|nr:orotidine-5'-phosphate decarboxylase [Candidatus Bathyarchaeota archaeon]
MLGRRFVEKYYELSREKDSFLCVGLDPATRAFRDKYVVPQQLIERHGVAGGLERFCVEFIEAVSPYTPIIKPNAQFLVYPLGFEGLKAIADAAHDGGCLALLDCKLSDIGTTMDAALHWIGELGFDAITFSPFPGYENGVDSVYRWAEARQKGIFALCRMSNPGTHDYQSRLMDGVPFYQRLAKDATEHGSNGFVVGCTATEELGIVRGIIGEERLILSPGLGPQGGDASTAVKLGSNNEGEGLLVSSSRSVNYAYEVMGWGWERFAEASAIQAKKSRDELNEMRKKAKR